MNTQYNPKFKIWNIFISSLISNTTKMTITTNTTYTSETPTDQNTTYKISTATKTQPLKTTINVRKDMNR